MRAPAAWAQGSPAEASRRRPTPVAQSRAGRRPISAMQPRGGEVRCGGYHGAPVGHGVAPEQLPSLPAHAACQYPSHKQDFSSEAPLARTPALISPSPISVRISAAVTGPFRLCPSSVPSSTPSCATTLVV